MATLTVCLARTQGISIVRWKNEWKMLEQEGKQRREEKEAAEKAREAQEDVELPATAETERRPEEESPVTTEGEDRDPRMRDDNELAETQGRETSMHANTDQEGMTPSPPMRVEQYNCNNSQVICMVTFEGAKSVGTDIVCIQQPYAYKGVLSSSAFDIRWGTVE